MKKIMLKESDLISLIEKVINEQLPALNYVIMVTKGSKQYYWGTYRDGSKMFIPVNGYSDLKSTPILYSSKNDAQIMLTKMEKRAPNYGIYEIKPFIK
jgi:hypothetical protein